MQVDVGAHRAAGSANRAVAVTVKDMGTVAIQTQCCLKTEESDLDDEDVAQQSSTAVQLVDALRVSKPAAGTCHASPVLPRAPSEASTIFVP